MFLGICATLYVPAIALVGHGTYYILFALDHQYFPTIPALFIAIFTGLTEHFNPLHKAG
jgi:hypothetical protein